MCDQFAVRFQFQLTLRYRLYRRQDLYKTRGVFNCFYPHEITRLGKQQLPFQNIVAAAVGAGE